MYGYTKTDLICHFCILWFTLKELVTYNCGNLIYLLSSYLKGITRLLDVIFHSKKREYNALYLMLFFPII